LISGADILALIPQRPPMVMIDRLYSVDNISACSGLLIRPDMLFVEDGLFTEPGIVEHIAQSCAARIGYICQQEQRQVPVGFIGTLNRFVFHALPPVGALLTTEITVEQELFEVSLVSARVFSGESLLAEGSLKIALQKESHE